MNAGLVAARRRGRRGGRPPAIDPETVEQIVAALDSGSSKSAVCRTFKVARSTLNDTLERIGWSGAGQHGSKKPKRHAQRPREQGRGKRLSREERERASLLRQYLGIAVGVRRSAAQIGEQLPAHDRKNGRTGELVSKIASSFVAEGFAEMAPGPRGGAGWSLTKKGKALIDRADGAKSFEASRAAGTPDHPFQRPFGFAGRDRALNDDLVFAVTGPGCLVWYRFPPGAWQWLRIRSHKKIFADFGSDPAAPERPPKISGATSIVLAIDRP